MGFGFFVLGLATVIFVCAEVINRNGRRADRERHHQRFSR